MFEGTSLDEAFASPMDHSTFAAGAAAGTTKPTTDAVAPRYDPSVYDVREEQQQQQQAPIVQQRAQQVVENFQPHFYSTPAAPVVQQQQPVAVQYVQQQQPYVPTLWDRMLDKRVDVARLVVVGLVIVFALSVDRTISHYLQDFISRSVLTDVKELLIRVGYPIGIIVLLWVLKSL